MGKSVSEEFQKFIDAVPDITIKPSDVTRIDTENYDKIVERYQELIAKLMGDSAALTQRMASQAESFQEQIREMVKAQEVMQQEFRDRESRASQERQEQDAKRQQMHDEQMAQQKEWMEGHIRDQREREKRQEGMMKEQREIDRRNHERQMAAMQANQRNQGGGILDSLLGAIPVVGGILKDLKR